MHLSINLRVTKKFVLGFSAIILAVVGLGLIFLRSANANPLPNEIKKQVSFKTVYPSSGASHVDSSSYKYQPSQKILSFSANYAGANITFYEQPAPANLGNDTPAYYPALGLHPYAQFQTKLGTVALAKFWQAGSLKPFGESAILVSNGTLLTAGSKTTLTNEQWKELFDSLKLAP